MLSVQSSHCDPSSGRTHENEIRSTLNKLFIFIYSSLFYSITYLNVIQGKIKHGQFQNNYIHNPKFINDVTQQNKIQSYKFHEP